METSRTLSTHRRVRAAEREAARIRRRQGYLAVDGRLYVNPGVYVLRGEHVIVVRHGLRIWPRYEVVALP